ncbi:hypothetical protein FQA39_LY12190 [Lamprigera yunnana]|nr:hypothetical protein FQA39_LY12190 [Lamprigera yunnana]
MGRKYFNVATNYGGLEQAVRVILEDSDDDGGYNLAIIPSDSSTVTDEEEGTDEDMETHTLRRDIPENIEVFSDSDSSNEDPLTAKQVWRKCSSTYCSRSQETSGHPRTVVGVVFGRERNWGDGYRRLLKHVVQRDTAGERRRKSQEDHQTPYYCAAIRQEHRLRSYGYLANLKFAPLIPNGVHEPEDLEDIKKERENMQMVHDLGTRAMYDTRAAGPSVSLLMTNTPINGRGNIT